VLLSYAARPIVSARGRRIVWFALHLAGASTLLAVAFFLHGSRGTNFAGDSPGQVFAALSVLAYAVGYAARGICREARVSLGLKLIQFVATLGCLWQTVAVYAQLNFVRDGWGLGQVLPDAGPAFAGLAGCVALFAAARVRIWILSRKRPIEELAPVQPP
jgi:hypothetical protein